MNLDHPSIASSNDVAADEIATVGRRHRSLQRHASRSVEQVCFAVQSNVQNPTGEGPPICGKKAFSVGGPADRGKIVPAPQLHDLRLSTSQVKEADTTATHLELPERDAGAIR